MAMRQVHIAQFQLCISMGMRLVHIAQFQLCISMGMRLVHIAQFQLGSSTKIRLRWHYTLVHNIAQFQLGSSTKIRLRWRYTTSPHSHSASCMAITRAATSLCLVERSFLQARPRVCPCQKAGEGEDLRFRWKRSWGKLARSVMSGTEGEETRKLIAKVLYITHYLPHTTYIPLASFPGHRLQRICIPHYIPHTTVTLASCTCTCTLQILRDDKLSPKNGTQLGIEPRTF